MNEPLPISWTSASLGDLVSDVQIGTVERGATHSPTVMLLKMGNLTWGGFSLEEVECISEDLLDGERHIVRYGDLLVNTRNTPGLVGKSAVWSGSGQYAFDNNIARIRLRDCDPFYVGIWLSSDLGRRRLRALAAASTSVAAIYWDTLKRLALPMPPIAEQRRIVAVLCAWDRAITTATNLSRARRRRFDAARQSLLESRQIARAGENEWRPIEFAELTSELTGRNAERLGPDRVMGVLKSEGLVPMRAHVMATDLRRYKVVPTGAFAYNPMRLNIGSIAVSEHSDNVLVSPDYIVFEARRSVADPNFLRFFVGTKKWRDHLALAGSGSVRTRIYYDNLAEMVLRIPSLEEQRKIGTMLMALKDDVAASEATLNGLRQQKRALMQKLLTGEWRLDERFDPVALQPGVGEAAA
ncbi:MAG: restriction endonuclease subunit S [Methylobacterium frigidaeris]